MKHPAKWWKTTDNNRVLCTLCPRFCKIGDSQQGFCFVRMNEGGRLYLTTYSQTIGLAVDPIEKKPLYHFLPGTSILSFGTAGCNLGCKFCQNWDMSKARIDESRSVTATPEQIVQLAKQHNCPGIAYTYNEPTIYGEFLIDVVKLAHENGIRNVMVTNGYITPEAREEIYPYIDAANVDLKAFTDDFYFKLASVHLSDILDTIKWLVNDTNVWIEITNLIIPGHNDNTDEISRMVDWILNNCGNGVPLHFSAFHPAFKMTNLPPTPVKTIIEARKLALKKGIRFVYTGNILDSEGSTTYCPNCGRTLIERGWFQQKKSALKNNRCKCGEVIEGVFE